VRSSLRAAVEQQLARSWWSPHRDGLARLLQPLSWLYGWLARRARQRVAPERLDVPVIVVGNLVVGGAGKTPTVIALLRLLRSLGWTPGVVSRGHGRRGHDVVPVRRDRSAEECGDEPLLIHLRTGAPVVVGADRVATARALRAAHPEIDLIVSDDGLQHHRLARDLQVVVFDDRGVGNGLLLPAGPLRERVPDRVPPHTLVVYNGERASTPWPGTIARRHLPGLVPLAAWWQGAAPDAAIWTLTGSGRVVAAAGIGVPERFFAMLRAHGLEFEALPLPDHHDFATLPWPADTAHVVLTEKDAVKLPPTRDLGAAQVWVAPLDFVLDDAFALAVRRELPRPPSSDTPR